MGALKVAVGYPRCAMRIVLPSIICAAVQTLTEFRPGDCVLNAVVHVGAQNSLLLLLIVIQCFFHQLPMLLDRFGPPTVCPDHWISKIPIECPPMGFHK